MPTAYQVALCHAKAYRVLRQDLTKALSPLDITVLEWLLLCSLDQKCGCRLSQVALNIGVEAPLVSQLIEVLCRKKLVILGTDCRDRRAKLLRLTANGYRIVTKSQALVEPELNHCLRELTSDEKSTHLKALELIISHDD